MAGELWRVCAVAVLCAVVGLLLRQIKGELSGLLRLGGGILILGLLLPMMGSVLGETELLLGDGGAYPYMGVMIRALGLAFLTRICTDVCRDCGESTVAAGVEMAGKAAILLLCFPLIGEIIEYAAKIMELSE
ncbi:MAG: hypothetical protein IJX94_03175 [Clostridia bacterium]|nr:hypothetical protein [Clostridia bacterium]